MILAKRHDHELRPRAGLLSLMQFFDEVIHPMVVAVDKSLTGPVFRNMPEQRALEIHGRSALRRRLGDSAFAVTAERDAMLTAVVPQVSGRRRHYFRSRLWFAALAVAVGPGLLREVGGVSGVTPLMSVLRDFTVAIQVVERHEVPRERVSVGSHVLAEQGESRIAIADSQIAENLVIGAVLTDDIDHVLDFREHITLNG